MTYAKQQNASHTPQTAKSAARRRTHSHSPRRSSQTQVIEQLHRTIKVKKQQLKQTQTKLRRLSIKYYESREAAE